MSDDTQHRIIVTGGGGFVGLYVQKAIEVLCAQRNQTYDLCIAGSSNGFDVKDRRAMGKLVREYNPTAVIHLAAIAAPTLANQSPDSAFDTNVGGSYNVARVILEQAPSCRLLFAGSAEAYGSSFFQNFENGITEDAPLKPQGFYGATKAAADLLLEQMENDGLKCIRFRAFNHSGAGQNLDFVLPAFAQQIAEATAGFRKPYIEVGNLEAKRDFLDVRDVARAYALGALAPADTISSGAYNLASGTPRRIGWILDYLIELSGIDIEIRPIENRMRVSDIAVTRGDITKVKKALGWVPEIPFEATVKDVLEDWQNRISKTSTS